MVRTTKGTSTGGSAVQVTGLSELVRNKEAIFLTELDTIQELKPESTKLVCDPSPGYRRSKLYLESLRRKTPPTDEKIYVGHQAAMEPVDYQLTPAAKALALPRARILMADGVGLGKTIEVGILLSELIRRGQGERILVVALKSILEQFQKELWGRFTIPLVRLDSVGLERVRAKIPSNMNPFYYFNRVIISIDTLKKDEKYRRFLEQCHWDAIVIDECQNVAVRTRGSSSRKSQRAKLASLLATTCDSLILTSATPHDGTAESFASLMNLLEPTAVANPSDYTQDDVKGLFVRRFKKDIAAEVSSAFQERAIELHKLPVCPEEDAVFDALAKLEFRTVDRGKKSKGVLFRTTLLKAFLSSPAACASTVRNRLKHKDLAEDQTSEEAEHDRGMLNELLALLERVPPKRFTKFKQLEDYLRQNGYDKPAKAPRVVIFSERLDTLALLETELTGRLKLKAGQIAVFHGSLDDIKQQAMVKEFGTESSDVRILLASDAASEGINLHFYCHRMVHFDVPWSLITLEQRNGRIDRYGQQHKPEIHYLLSVPSDTELKGDLRVLERLIDKEHEAHKNLGDAAWLMGLHDPEKEEERIGIAVSNHEDAESVLPDDPPPDPLLELLLAGGNTESEPKAPDSSPASTEDVAVATGELLSLYEDDLSYAKAAFSELVSNDPKAVHPPEFHEHLDGLTVSAPDDLQRRYAYLPPELHHDQWEIRLTTDRTRVQDALIEARQKQGTWPNWELLWNQHPVAEWLNDRVLSVFTRHEAPVIRIAEGLDEDEVLFVFQGVLSNARSQPVVVEWFGVLVDSSEQGSVLEEYDLIESTGLDGDIPNPGGDVDTGSLEALLPIAVRRAAEHMDGCRLERSERVAPKLRTEQRRVKRWYKASIAQIDEVITKKTAQGRKLRSDEQRRFDEQRAVVERRMKARAKWIDDGLRTIETPYLRVAAAVVSRERD